MQSERTNRIEIAFLGLVSRILVPFIRRHINSETVVDNR